MSSIWLPIKECQQCHKTYQIKQGLIIQERRAGVLTGRKLELCPSCGYEFMNGDIKEASTNLDNKSKLQKWNKVTLEQS